MLRIIRYVFRSQNPLINRNFLVKQRKLNNLAPRLIGLIPVVAFCKGEELQAPDPSSLSHTQLIKNASVSTIDSASALLTQSATALLDTMELYMEAMERQMKLIELQLQVFGSETTEAKVWDALVMVRSQVNTYRTQKQSLELVYHSAVTALHAAAEVAHITGAEYAGQTGSERVHSAATHVTRRLHLVEAREAALLAAETRSIEEIGKKMEEQEIKVTFTDSEIPTTEEQTGS